MFKITTSVLAFWKRVAYLYKKSALALGVIIPILLYVFTPDINVLSDPLSRFGIIDNTQTVWIVFNQLMAIALFMFGLSANRAILSSYRKRAMDILLTTAIVAFSASGMVTMDIHIAHLTLAGIFFVLYLAYIFWYGYFMKGRHISLSLWATGLVLLSLAGIIVTFATGISYGFFEMVFITSVVIWNILMLRYKIV